MRSGRRSGRGRAPLDSRHLLLDRLSVIWTVSPKISWKLLVVNHRRCHAESGIYILGSVSKSVEIGIVLGGDVSGGDSSDYYFLAPPSVSRQLRQRSFLKAHEQAILNFHRKRYTTIHPDRSHHNPAHARLSPPAESPPPEPDQQCRNHKFAHVHPQT